MSNKRKITYKCPYCDKRFNKEDLVSHVGDKHDDMIPEGYSAFRLVFDYVNKKPSGYNGKCIICGKETGWDENKGKYNRICSNPVCKKKYIQSFEERMMKSKGVTRISSTAEGQAKMLANRKISGEYKFQDGGIRTYTGTYEKKALEFMDKVMNIKSIDVTTPGPILEYDFEGKTHIYISDIYYAPYNLIIEVKDGGNNPNMRSMPEYRAKQIAKEKYIIKYTDYNYLRLTNNDFSQLLAVFMELKMEMSNDTPERVIRINEGVISDRLKYPYKYGEAKKINQELTNKINSTNYPWYFINITELINSGVDINLYGYDEEPVEGVDKPKYKSHHLYNKKVKAFHGRDSLNPSLRKYSKFNKGAAKTKDVVLKEEYIEESNNELSFKSDKELLEWMKKNIKYSNFRKLKSHDEVLKTKSGSCHDQVMFEYEELKKLGYSPRGLFIIELDKNGQGGTTHSLVYYRKGNKICWFENAWKGQEGIGEHDSLNNIKDIIRDMYNNYGWGNLRKYGYLEFKSFSISSHKPGESLQQFVDICLDDSIKENYIEEGFLKSEPDILYNKEAFDNGDINICFITGHSGSGKSTLSRSFKSDNSEIIELDFLICIKDFYPTLNDIKNKIGDLTYSYFKGPGKDFFITKKELKENDFIINGKAFEDRLYTEFVDYAIKYSKSHKDKRFILEGVWIFCYDDHWKPYFEPSYFKDYAFYIKGTSAIKSKIRAAKRDSEHFDGFDKIKALFRKIVIQNWKWYKLDEKRIQVFRDYFKDKPETVLSESALLETKNDKQYYHVSQSNLDGKTLQPSIPNNYFTKNGYEDNKTKRVCFTNSIDNCLRALSQKCTNMELYVHILDGNYNVYTPSIDEVPDCKVTGEVWVTKPCKVKCIGKIKVIGDRGEDSLPFKYGNKTAELYDWDWEWIEQFNESYIEEAQNNTLSISQIKAILKKISDKVKSDSKPPTGNQNCMLCTWCLEAQLRGYDILPRGVYSPRDIIFKQIPYNIIKNPEKLKIRNKNDVTKQVLGTGNGSRYYVHVNWKGGSGGHEFIIMNINNKVYVLDAQQNELSDINISVNGLSYFNDINYANSYIIRLDDKELNKDILKYNDNKYIIYWDDVKDPEYMQSDEYLNEAYTGELGKIQKDPEIIDSYGFISSDGIYNENVKIKGFNKWLRGRSELLIIDKDKVYLKKDPKKGYSIPGGGWEKDEDHNLSAIRETNEEARIKVKNVSYVYSYASFFDPKDWVKEKISKENWWYGEYTELYIGEYDGQYKGEVEKIDQDKAMESGKFYDIKSIYNDLIPVHQEALSSIVNEAMSWKESDNKIKSIKNIYYGLTEAESKKKSLIYKGKNKGVNATLEGLIKFLKDNDMQDIITKYVVLDTDQFDIDYNIKYDEEYDMFCIKAPFEFEIKDPKDINYSISESVLLETSISRYKKIKIDRSLIESDPVFKHLREDHCRGYAFYDKDKLVGFVNVEDKDGESWIQALEIMPDYRNQGLGKSILDIAVKELKANYLSVNKKNTVAISMYKKYGFKTYKETETMYFMSLKEELSEASISDYTFLDIKSNKSKALEYLKSSTQTKDYADDIIKNYVGEIVLYNNEMIGRIFVGDKKDKGFITDFEISKEHRGNKLGSKLIDDAIIKYHGIDLLVDKDNKIAIDMYKKRGFVVIKTVKNQYWMKLKSEIKEDTNMTEAMNALMTGYIPGSVDNPNNVYIVNYMQNNVFSDEDPNEDCIGVSDNPKFTNLIVRDNTGMLKRVDESFLKDKTYKVYILEMSRDEVNKRLGKYLGGFVKKNFIYEALTGHKLYTKDQIQFESMFIPTVDYYEFMESFKEICDNYFQVKDKKFININESTFVPEEVKVFNKSGLMEIKKVHSMDDYVSAKPSKVLEYLDISIKE